MPPLRFVLTRDPEEFAVRTEKLLAAHLECNVLATVLRTVLEGSRRDPAPIFAVGVTDQQDVSFAAMRTPPWPLLASPLNPDQAEALIDRWLQHDPDVPAVSGPPETARAIAAAWARRTGGTARRTFSEGMHVLTEVSDPPRPAAGTLRLARTDERDLLVRWTEEFIGETGLIGGAQAASMVDVRLRQQGLLVWEDGQAVSMVGVNPAVSGVVRIGPVYTPRPLRRRGYAGSAVAAVSRRALAGGAERCMLYTDLTNPTSNKIYAEVGYRRCGDWEEIALERG
jgi:RimJ/RimL family protein N-acetyltransferase